MLRPQMKLLLNLLTLPGKFVYLLLPIIKSPVTGSLRCPFSENLMFTLLPASFFKLEVKEVLRLLGPTMSSVGYRGFSNLQVLTIALSKLLDSVSILLGSNFSIWFLLSVFVLKFSLRCTLVTFVCFTSILIVFLFWTLHPALTLI